MAGTEDEMAMMDHAAVSLQRLVAQRNAAGVLWQATRRGLERAVTRLLDWQERSWQRRQLLALGDRGLKDIGRSRADADAEARKPCWRA
jgi:uncharacterized protein YjiS (DUF1127 family)